MAEVITYIDPDAVGGGTGVDWVNAYTSMSAWDAGEQTDLPTDGDWHHAYVRSSGGTADTTAFAIAGGWVTGAANYILVEVASSDRAVKTGWDAARYRMSGTDTGTGVFNIQDDYVRVDGMQIETAGATSDAPMLYIPTVGAGDIRISNCRFRSTDLTNFCRCIHILDVDAVVNVWNCIMEDASDGINLGNGTCNAYNSISYGMEFDGYERDAGTFNIENSVSFGNATDWDGTFNVQDYTASDDGGGTNEVAESGGGAAWPNDFTDAGAGNFTLLVGSNLRDAGLANPSAGLYTTDIEGDAYTVAGYSLGVDEYVAIGGARPQNPLGHPLVGSLGGPIGGMN